MDNITSLLEILAEIKENGFSWDARYDNVIARATRAAQSEPATRAVPVAISLDDEAKNLEQIANTGARVFSELVLSTLRDTALRMREACAAPTPDSVVPVAIPPIFYNGDTKRDTALREACDEQVRAGIAANTSPPEATETFLQDIQTVLTNVVQILDVVKVEWAQTDSWSEWDQSVRDSITKILAAPTPDADKNDINNCTICGLGLVGHAQVVAEDTTRRAHLKCWAETGRTVIFPGWHE